MLCRMSVSSEYDRCWSARPERSRLLTRSPCGWALATWCSLTWRLIPREAGGEEVEEARVLRGEATGLVEAEGEATIVTTVRGAPAHSSLGVTLCCRGVRHPGASTTQVEGARGGAEEALGG